ncbi:MAG: VC0807 family protein [Acidimicrobiales bacterium]
MAEVEVGRLEASGDGTAAPAAAGLVPSTETSAGHGAAGAGGSPAPPAPGPLGPPERLRTLAPIVVFDVAGPLAVYYGARAAGMPTVLALVVSGALPAVRVLATVVRHRRLDAIGALVLSGIALGTVMGLASGSARLYLLDGLVPPVVLGLVCLLSLLSHRPVMFRLALETMGEGTAKGRAFAGMWQYAEFRRLFRVITVVWGLVFLAESAVQAVIVETASINTAKQTSNLLPVAVLVLTFVWTRNYGRRAQERGERLLAEQDGAPQSVFPGTTA